MVLTRFTWRHGGRQVFLCGSFWRWTDRFPMTLIEGSSTVFLAICDIPPGLHQYRFLVDGVWRCDEQQYRIDDHGTVNNVILIGEPEPSPTPIIPDYVSRPMEWDDDISGMAPVPYMPPETMVQIPASDMEASRCWLSRILSNQTIYDILPVSSKISIVGAQLPVKQAFHIMHEEGLAVVPIWDDSSAHVTGMLTASDFILILRELQNNVRMLANEELEMHSVSAWKEGKSQLFRQSNGPVGLNLRPLIHVLDNTSLKDVALRIVQNEISAVPIFKSLQDASCMPLLNVASLPGILKYICSHFGEVIGSMPFLQQPICNIPLGTWLAETGRSSGRQLAILRSNMPLSSALDLLLEGRVSSIPVVADDGSLIDVYSRSDIIALAKGDMYAQIQLDQMTMQQALDQVYQANPHNSGRRLCHTCYRSTSIREVLEQLSDPGVRRLVVINSRSSRQVEGIISLRDVLQFLLG